MSKTQIVLSVIQVLACLFLIITVLLQEGQSQGVNGVVSGGAETFFGSNKAHGMQAMLVRVTAVVGIIFAAAAVALNLLK